MLFLWMFQLTRLESPLDERFQWELPSDSSSLIAPDYVVMLKNMLCEEEMTDKLRAINVNVQNEPVSLLGTEWGWVSYITY